MFPVFTTLAPSLGSLALVYCVNVSNFPHLFSAIEQCSVVVAGQSTRHGRHDFLHPPPKVRPVQNPIHPPRRDAVTPVMIAAVVFHMRTWGENNATKSQRAHKGGWSCLVRPLVNLVGQSHEKRKCQKENVLTGVVAVNIAHIRAMLILREQKIRLQEKSRDEGKHCVRVCLNEVVLRDGGEVHVVFAERANEVTEERRLRCPPCVKAPVNNTADEVRKKYRADDHTWGPRNLRYERVLTVHKIAGNNGKVHTPQKNGNSKIETLHTSLCLRVASGELLGV